MIEQSNWTFMGTRQDNQSVSSTTWTAMILTTGASAGRDFIQVHVAASSTGSLQINDNNTDVYAWWQVSPGQTFDIPLDASKNVYMRAVGGTCICKWQEVQL